MGRLALVNGRLITPFRQIPNGTIIINGKTIEDCGLVGQVTIPGDAKVIDLKDLNVSPGFIDLHIHGAWGGDVMSASLIDLEKMACGLAKTGVTSFLPTTLTAPFDKLEQIINCIEQAATEKKNGNGAKILGVHLEGPYLNRNQQGAQNPEWIAKPNHKEYCAFLDRHPIIKRMSAAPEIPGGLELGLELQRRGIVASIAHSDATYQEVLQAIEHGYSHVTHIFSGMSGVRRIDAYRVPGVIESTLLIDELTTEIIADGHHLPPSLIRLVIKSKGLENICLVTDSMSAAGLGPGQYELGGLKVIVEDNIPENYEIKTRKGNLVAKLVDRSAFASSVATMNQMVRNMTELIGLSLQDAIKLVTFNPALMQKVDGDIGIIAKGKRADLVVFNDSIEIAMTMIDGKIVYQK
ncbi:MAG: N-acetylglucosamine-6-phosphate deacetylase [Bacteroidota bacterium]